MRLPPRTSARDDPMLSPWEWEAPLVTVVGLALISQWNYLLFHVAAELFIAAVGLMMFFIASSVARFGQSHFLLVLGAGFFWVSLLEVFHTIAYKGMGILFHGSANEATQLWIAARGVEAIALVIAPLFIGRRVPPVLPFAGFGAAALLCGGTVISGHFPDAFLDPEGLTPFKIVAEWTVIALMGVAGLLIWRRRADLPPRPRHLLLTALALSAAAELAFTLYTGIYAYWNILGHLLIFLAFWMIFLATVKTMLTEPFVHVTRDATILEMSPDPTVLVGLDFRVTRMNRAAEQAFGAVSEGGVLPLFTLLGPDGRWNRSQEAILADTRRLEGSIPPPTTLRLRDVWYDVRIRPLRGSVLGQSAIVVFRDVTDSKRAQERLVQSNAELEQFAHVLSHELQTPIRSIVSYLGLIERKLGASLDADTVEDMRLASQAGKRMSAMIHGLLDYANVRPTDHPLEPLCLDLPLSDALAALKKNLVDSRASVTLPHGLPKVLGNRDQLAHVFHQILDNAIKYVPRDRAPEVSITVQEMEEQVRLSFIDNGIGVPDKDSQVIFGVFKRLHTEEEVRGTGLGLPIAKRLLELHGGHITLRPRMNGPGSVFTVSLWKANAAAPYGEGTVPSDSTEDTISTRS